MLRLKIADLVVDINCINDLIEKSFFNFELKSEEITNSKNDILWNVFVGKEFDSNKLIERKILFETEDLTIYGEESNCSSDSSECVYLYKKENVVPTLIYCKKEFSECNFYISSYKYEEIINNNELLENVKICLYNTFREVFVLACAYRNRIPIHSASIIYNDKAYLFSAASGVGKSTHTNMWTELYGSEILDGDVAICRFADYTNEDGDIVRKPFAYGIPWCGTSGLYVNKKVIFGGIVFLERAEDNSICQIDNSETAISIFNNLFIPLIREEILDKCLEVIEGLSDEVKGYILKCLPNHEAVEITKNMIIR